MITPGDRRPLPALRELPGGRVLGGSESRMWALASGSGGVGRSTLAALLAGGLLRRGRSVCLVDADWTGPSLASLLDIGAAPQTSAWADGPLVARRSLAHDELRVVPGDGPLRGDPSRRACGRLLRRLRASEEDQLVLDLPAGTTDRALDLWLAADFPVLVAVPERLPLEATARLLARVFARVARPWLDRKLGRERAGQVLDEAWRRSEGRSANWMRSVARVAGLVPDEIADFLRRRPLYLVLNRVRRGDDIDVGHALVTAAGHGLGLDLRFRGVLPYHEDGWIRARRAGGPGVAEGGPDIDELLDRVVDDREVAPPGDLTWNLKEAAALVGTGGRRSERPPWR